MAFEEYFEKLKSIVKKHPKGKPLDKDGKFYPDPTPHAPQVGSSLVADIDMFEVMRTRIRNEISIQAQLAGEESFDEANDFEVEDEFEPFSPWEEIVEQAKPDGPIVRPEAKDPDTRKSTSKAADAPGGGSPAATKPAKPASKSAPEED